MTGALTRLMMGGPHEVTLENTYYPILSYFGGKRSIRTNFFFFDVLRRSQVAEYDIVPIRHLSKLCLATRFHCTDRQTNDRS